MNSQQAASTLDKQGLIRMLRSLPRSAVEQQRRLVEHSSIGVAALIHVSVMVWILTLPEFVTLRPLETQHTVAPRTVEVVQITLPEKKEAVEEPKVVIDEAPAPVEAPQLAKLDLTPPPKVEPAPKPRVTKRVKRKPRRVAKRKPRGKAKPARKVATASASPVTPITAPGGADVAAADMGPGSTDADATADGRGSAPAQAGPVDVSLDPPASSEPEIDVDAMMRGYVGRVGRAVHREFRYPRAAARAGVEGRVLVEIVVDDQGRIVSSRVLRSSGHAVLDRAALKAVASIAKVPAPPTELRWSRRPMQVPFVYRLSTRS